MSRRKLGGQILALGGRILGGRILGGQLLVGRLLVAAGAVLIVLAGLEVQPAFSAPTPQQRTKARVAGSALTKAQSLTKQKKYKEAGLALKQAQTVIAELGPDAEGGKLVAPLFDKLTTLHGDLELQGIKLDPLPPAPQGGAEMAESKPGKPGKPTPGGAAAGGAGAVSFTKQVAPMLVDKCGGCHVRGSKGGFNFVNFTGLMKGSKDGIVISPKSGEGSRIVEVIQNGDMPRGGGKVAPEQVAMLIKWINEGAKFDGPDPNADIADLKLVAKARNDKDINKVEVAMATGKESVSFAHEIGPVLMTQCYGCHGEGRRAQGRYDMDEFKGVLKGGESGEALTAGKPDVSLIIQKLKGTAKDGARMPKDRPPLSAETIAKFEKWIAEGARFDGFDADAKVTEVVAVAHAEKISPEELAKERTDLGVHNWKLVLPDGGEERVETDNFLVFGNAGKDILQETAKIAEEQGAKLQKLMKLPTGPLIKGRTTIYVFDKKYDYGEIGTMLEGREVPPDSRGHWRYTTVDAYICVVPPKNKEYSLSAMIGQELAGVMVAAQGHVPRWFAEGSSRILSTRLDPKDVRYKQWEDVAREAISGGVKPEGFLKGSGPDNDAIAYMFVKQLMTDSGRYAKLMNGVKAKMRFNDAFAQAYGMPPDQLVAAWTKK